MMLSILLSAFIAFSPNINHLMEKDFMRRTYTNSVNHSLKYGQLAIRANTLTASQNKKVEVPLRSKGEEGNSVITWYLQDKMSSIITITNNKDVQVSIDREVINE